MIDREMAQRLLCDHLNSPRPSNPKEEFVVSSCELSEREDYWILDANARAYVEDGDLDYCHAGVSAYLVSTTDGSIVAVGSGQTVESCLQEKYDIKAAQGRRYALASRFGPHDKRAIIHFHHSVHCSLREARELVSQNRQAWFWSDKQTLEHALAMCEERGIAASIILVEPDTELPELGSGTANWDDIAAVLRDRCKS